MVIYNGYDGKTFKNETCQHQNGKLQTRLV